MLQVLVFCVIISLLIHIFPPPSLCTCVHTHLHTILKPFLHWWNSAVILTENHSLKNQNPSFLVDSAAILTENHSLNSWNSAWNSIYWYPTFSAQLTLITLLQTACQIKFLTWLNSAHTRPKLNLLAAPINFENLLSNAVLVFYPNLPQAPPSPCPIAVTAPATVLATDP